MGKFVPGSGQQILRAGQVEGDRETSARNPKSNSGACRQPQPLAVARLHPRWRRDRWTRKSPAAGGRLGRLGETYPTRARIVPRDRWTQCARPAAQCGGLRMRAIPRHQLGQMRLRRLAAVGSRPGPGQFCPQKGRPAQQESLAIKENHVGGSQRFSDEPNRNGPVPASEPSSPA